MDRRPTDDAAPLRSDLRELRVNTESTEWVGAPSPRRVLTAPNSPSTAFRTDREAIFRSGNATVAETHLIRSTGSQSNSFTEEHWSSEITSFVTAAPPKFIQVIKAYRILSSDTPTLVVEVASDPPAIFEWFCNDKPVQQDRRRFQARHGLNITTLTVHQPEQGVYKCTARNPAGVSTSYGYITVNFEHQYDEWTIVDRSMVTQEGQTTVTVHRSPRFINQVPNLTVQPGSEVVIDVEVDADPPARFTWFVNGREFRESSKGVELFYPSTNRCVVKFAFPVSGEYKVVASNVHGSAMSSGYVEIHRAKPSKQMRPPVSAGEHISRNIMAASHHAGSTATPTAPDGQELLQTHQTVDVYEVNYTQRASSVPRGVRHLESHVEMPISPRRRVSLEQHRAEIGKKLPDRLPRSLYKTRSEGARYLPHAPNFITTLPAEITVNPNEKLVLSVDVTALPMAEFRWDVNGFEVKSSKNITLLNEQNRSTLVVQPPIKQGRYNVVAFNSEGRESQQTRVLVETHVVEEAQAAETKAGPDIQESSVTVTSTNEPDWDIVDSVASTASTTSFLTVTRRELPAKDEVPKTKTVIKEEKTIVLNGVASQVPVVVQEMKAEETTTSETFVKAKSAPRVEEKLPKKPVLLSEPWQDLHLKVGEKLILEMKVDSIPPATFRWYVNNFEAKNGQFVSITQPHDNVSIAIFSKPTPGQYKVVAANPLGEVTSITRITTERTVEEFKESTTVTTSLPRPPLFTLKKKPIITVREDLPKPPHIIEKLPPLLRINSTSPISLQVRADAVPEATFMWLLNNFELRKTQNIEISRLASNVSQLHLQKVQPGRYDVVASNRLGQDSSSCKVIVQYEQEEPAASPKPPPIFTQSLSKETVVLLGEETRIEVIASGTPPFSFKWFINGSEISSSKDIEIVVDGNRSTLRVQKSLGNKAVLIVEVTDRNGTARSETIIKEISKTTTMVEAIPPRVTTTVKEVTETRKEVVEKQPSPAANKAPMFTQKLDNIELMEGDTLRCHVKVSDESDSCTFEWYANDMQITSGEQVFIESGLRESRLSIENMGEMSGVKLTAIARNPHGTSVSAAELNVVRGPDESFEMVPPDVPEESAPKIIEPLHSASFIDGQPMVLRCRIKAVPSAVIVWSKDDLNVDEWVINKDIVTQIHPDGICELMNPEVYPEDSGLYKCTATNPHGTAETAAYINIQGPLDYSKGTEDGSASAESAMMPEEPPKFVEKLTAETDGAYDLNYIRLICRVKSIIRAKITWWKNDVQLIPGEKYELHEFSDGALILTIHSPTPSDNGIYTCKAESENGLSSTSCEVIVPTRTITTEKVSETQTETETITETVDHSSFEITETSKEDYIATTEITKHEEEYKLLVKVAENVASALVANVFVDAVREAVKKIMEEESEEEEIEVTNAPRFETCIERYVVKENDTVTISTVVTGEPTPFIEWYFKDQKLNVTEQISMGYENRVATLILKNVTFAQEGTYYCHATNTHGTTVLPSEVKVVPEKASDTVRISLAKYDKREGSEQLITNVHAYHTDELHEQSIGVHVPEKESVSGRCSAIPSRSEKIAEVPPEQSTVEKQLLEQISSQQKSEVVQPPEQPAVGVQPTEQPPAAIEPIGPSPVPPPRKHTPKEKEVVVPIIRETSRTEDDVRESEERKVRSVAVKFAEKLAENVMSQAQTDLRSSVQTDESTIRITQVSGAKVLEKGAQDTEAVEKVPTTISAFPLQTSTIISKSAASMEETSQAGMTTIDVRKPDTQFDHVVTVVEPEVVQLGLRLPSPSVPSMKFIDLETILQRPGTSSSANTLISSPHRGAANAEHRIVLLEGMSQKFHNAMTLSLKKVKRLATESAEPSSFVQVEIIKPNETSEEVLTIVNAEKLIPDLLRVAAAASKLKMENVTVSLVKQGDAAHQELVIEYESHVEDAAHFNLSQLLYENPQREVSSRQETWSRRSRFSDVDENVVAVFMEVDANCPNQSVEIVASVSTPLESKVDRSPSSPSPERLEVSESLTESSSAVGQQIPKFVRTLQDCQTVIGRSAQFKCIVTGMPPPEVAWYVDGDVIHSCREYEIVYEDGVCILRINEAMAEDEGEYSCEAKNSAGKAVTKCYLKVLTEEPTEETCVPAGAIATINCETLTEQLNIEWKKEGNSLVVSRGKTREIDSRFIAEDSEDGRQHSLTIVSVQPGDAGEYGVVIDGVYTIVTRIVVTESEVFTQFIYEEPEIDVSLQMDSVKDDACVGMTEQVKTRLEKDVQQSDVEAVAGEEGFEIVDADEVEVHRAEEVMRKEAVSQFPEKEFAVVEKDLHVTEKEELKSKKVVELDLKRIDEAALEAAAAVAMEITEKLLADAFTEVDQIEKEEREAPAMPQVLSSSDVTTPTSDTFEKVPEIFIEPMTDEGVSTPEELPEDDLTLADLSAGGFEFVRSLVEESIQKAMAEVSSMEVHALIADKGEKSAEMVEVQRESEQKRITDVEDLTSKTSDQPDAGSLHEKPSEEQILKIDAQVPEKGEEAVYQRGPEELKSKEEEEEVPSERLLDTGSDVTAVFKEVDNLQARDIVSEGAACIASEFVTAQVEDVAVLLQFDREDTHSAVDFSFARPRKCKLTVFLTFDQAIDVVPTEEVHLHVEYSHASQTESSEVILSQIMYEDDEASTIDDTLTSISSSCLYCPPEFVSPLQPKYEIQRNTRALLKVVVTGVPLPQVIWYHNGNVLNSIKNVLNIIYEDGVSFLEIYNCTERWSGVFTCEAKNSAGVTKIESILTVLPEESEGPVRPTEIHLSNIPFQEDVEHIIHDSAHRDFHSAALTLGVDASVLEQRSSSPEVSDYSSASSGAGQAPTFIVTMPPQIYSKVNENIQLKCTFTGQPLPAVTWEKDGNLVDLNRNYNIITEDGVTILRLECTTLEDNAIFSCTVANNFGMQTANCKVIIEDEVLEHKHIGTQVICDRESASGEVDAVMMSPRTTATTFTFPSSEVVERSKEHGETKEDVSIEDVDEQKPVFLLPLEDSVFKGNTSTLKCIIMAAPTALIEWKIDDQVVTKDEEHGIIYEDGIAILKIRNIQRDDLRVSCTATNRNGRAESHCQLTRVHERSLHEEGQSPRFIIPLKNICTCAEEVTLKCIIEAEPIPEVTWFVDENMQTQ
ncbi:hypothetical protein V3C99_013768, partial [Haemonchus contortus]